MLHLGIAATDADRVILQAESWFGRWEPEVPWTPTPQALLDVAGQALLQGCFVDEVCELVDRTDVLCLHYARLLKADGSDSPITSVVANTYNQVRPADGRGLAASYVVTAFELTSMMRRFRPDGPAAGLARRFAAVEGSYSWGRLMLASLSVDPRDPLDQAEFASLLRRSWEAGGYHLQLAAVRAAEFFAGSDVPYRTEILDVVKGFQASNWGLQNTIIEVLSRFGEVDCGLTAEDLREEIRDLLGHSDASEACQAAAGIVSNQFEDENIVGPYSEAIAGLTGAEKVRLLTMASSGSDITISMFLDWTLDELSALVPSGDPSLDEMAKAAFGTFLNGPPSDSVMPTEATKACLAAIRGWAKFDNALPPATDELDDEERNWRLVAGLLLCLERDDVVGDPADAWRQLHQDRRNTISRSPCSKALPTSQRSRNVGPPFTTCTRPTSPSFGTCSSGRWTTSSWWQCSTSGAAVAATTSCSEPSAMSATSAPPNASESTRSTPSPARPPSPPSATSTSDTTPEPSAGLGQYSSL